MFRIRASCLQTFKTQFKGNKEYKKDMYSCWHCPNVDSSRHAQYFCSEYEDLRSSTDFSKEEDIIWFFQQVIKSRIEKENMDEDEDEKSDEK